MVTELHFNVPEQTKVRGKLLELPELPDNPYLENVYQDNDDDGPRVAAWKAKKGALLSGNLLLATGSVHLPLCTGTELPEDGSVQDVDEDVAYRWHGGKLVQYWLESIQEGDHIHVGSAEDNPDETPYVSGHGVLVLSDAPEEPNPKKARKADAAADDSSRKGTNDD